MAMEEQAKKEIVAALRALYVILDQSPRQEYPHGLCQHPEVKKLLAEIEKVLAPHSATLDPEGHLRNFLTCDVLPLKRLPARPDVRQWLDYYIKDFGGEPVEPPQEDGPVEPDGFAKDGTVYRGLARKPFFALRFLWSRRNRSAQDDELAEPVWEDHELVPDNNALYDLRREINNFFRDHGIAFHATAKHRCLSILDGPPASKKKRTTGKKARKRSR